MTGWLVRACDTSPTPPCQRGTAFTGAAVFKGPEGRKPYSHLEECAFKQSAGVGFRCAQVMMAFEPGSSWALGTARLPGGPSAQTESVPSALVRRRVSFPWAPAVAEL
jgi:hypothetical protein